MKTNTLSIVEIDGVPVGALQEWKPSTRPVAKIVELPEKEFFVRGKTEGTLNVEKIRLSPWWRIRMVRLPQFLPK